MQYLIKDNVLIGPVTTQSFGYLIIFESVQPRIFYNLLTRLYKHVVIHVCLSFRPRFKENISPDSHSFVSELTAREKVTDSLHGNAQDKNQGAPCQTKQGHEGERK